MWVGELVCGVWGVFLPGGFLGDLKVCWCVVGCLAQHECVLCLWPLPWMLIACVVVGVGVGVLCENCIVDVSIFIFLCVVFCCL